MTLASGARLGPYEIVSLLGRGGMGEVWKARDTRLDRIVAIKRVTSPTSDRFEQEARAIAALNHPHICQIYDVGPDYLVLEYVEGQPIRGPLPVDEVLRLAVQIAGALQEAHRKSILHRDLKPANIMITGGSGGSLDLPAEPPKAKLLDFGLAKLVSGDDDATRTLEGTVLGTAGYMAPEQAEGRFVDARSDVFSFGAVLYEMLSGIRAFAGQSIAQQLNAVLRIDPPPLETVPALERIVRQCLAKQPAQRFQTMAELKAALEQVVRDQASPKPVEQPQPSLAVLPFANMTADKENEYFSDGLAEEIINALAHIPGLKVIARTSAFAFKGRNEDVRRIAEALGVAHILEGSVRKAGNHLRVAAQLITATDGSHLWSERYDREMIDVFAIQDEIAQAIAGALEVRLSAEPAVRRHRTPGLPAYEAYLKARHEQWRLTPEAMALAALYYQQAIALDPEFALARSGHADHYLALAGLGQMHARDAMPLVRAEAQAALALDQSLPDAQAMLGIVAALFDYNWEEAERRFRLAMAREPVPPQVRVWYGYFALLPTGRFREAAEENERALKEDPLNISFHMALGACLQAAGKFDAAATEFRHVLGLDQNFFAAPLYLSVNPEACGTLPDALAAAERAYALAPWSSVAIAVLAGLLARTGARKRAEALMEKLGPGEAPGAALAMAMFHLLDSQIDRAADWTEKAIEQRDPNILERLAILPFAQPLRSSPRWTKLASLMNLPQSRGEP